MAGVFATQASWWQPSWALRLIHVKRTRRRPVGAGGRQGKTAWRAGFIMKQVVAFALRPYYTPRK